VATSFLLERCIAGGRSVHLLPTADVVMVVHQHGIGGSPVKFVFPHRGVVVLDDVAECMSLSPNLIKCLLGEPSRFIGCVIAADSDPMLKPFAEAQSISDTKELLEDLRSSLTITHDEQDFIELWKQRVEGEALPTNDRRVQRLSLRFAGQSPRVINVLDQLARTLHVDNASGFYNGLGEFADASHYARVCKTYTGRTPATWRNMSQTFY
jgi:hypothetical protein